MVEADSHAPAGSVLQVAPAVVGLAVSATHGGDDVTVFGTQASFAALPVARDCNDHHKKGEKEHFVGHLPLS